MNIYFKLINNPMTISCLFSRFEKQTVFRASRLIHVLKFKFLRSILRVFFLPTSCFFSLSVAHKPPPLIRVVARNTKRFEQGLPFFENDILALAKHIFDLLPTNDHCSSISASSPARSSLISKSGVESEVRKLGLTRTIIFSFFLAG